MERHYCTFCGAKKNDDKLIKVRYKLLKKVAYHCSNCVSAISDFFQIVNDQKKGTFLELFSGSGMISEVAKSYDFKICRVDINEKFQTDICKNILQLTKRELPQDISFIWASIPCTCFSINSLHKHFKKINYDFRKYYYYPVTDEAKRSIQVLEKTLSLIRSVAPMYYIIENPRGALRHMPQMKNVPFRYTISYNDYGFNYYKPTDLFTNIPGLELCKIKTCVGKKFETEVNKLSDEKERSLVPPALIHQILSKIYSVTPSTFTITDIH